MKDGWLGSTQSDVLAVHTARGRFKEYRVDRNKKHNGNILQMHTFEVKHMNMYAKRIDDIFDPQNVLLSVFREILDFYNLHIKL